MSETNLVPPLLVGEGVRGRGSGEVREACKAIITCGYGGKSRDRLWAWVKRHDAVVVDIRFSPISRDPQWNGRELCKAFFGRYEHCAAWGNRNHANKTLPVDIADFDYGWEKVDALRSGPDGRRVVLLCGCPQLVGCHRHTIASMIHDKTGEYCADLQLPWVNKPKENRDQPQEALAL